MLEFFCRHLIGLCITYKDKEEQDSNRERFAIISGTLIFIRDALLFLTAGHALEKVDILRNSDGCEITSAGLADTFGWKRVSDVPVPFDIRNASLFYIDEEREGLDFGAIVIGTHYAMLACFPKTG